MEQKHRQILQRHRLNLVKALNPEDVCDKLLSKGVFTQDMIDEIQSKATRRDQARQLVKDLETRGSLAFPAFLDSLRETGHNDLAELLQSGDGVHRPPVISVQPSPIPLPVQNLNHTEKPDKPDIASPRLVPLRPESLPVHKTYSPPSETVVRPTRPRRDSIQCYKMDASPCGVCLIINNINFEKASELNDRKGSNIDCDKLEKRFKALNFEVTVKRNLKSKRIRHEMASLAKKDHSTYDCCVVIILSHGTEASHNRFPGAVHGVDGPAVPIQIITNYLNGQNCPSLQGKPKLFFIQACGGGEKDIGFEVSPDDVQPCIGGIDDEMDAIPMSSSSDSLSTASDELDARASLPTPSDILVSYSTFPGYVSWRDTEAGSWYVENLDRVLEENAITDDLVTMLMLSREICTLLQDGLLKVTIELHTTLKTYYQYYTEFLSAEGKLKEAVKLEEKQKQSASKKMERQIEKRQCKVQEIQLKCTKARNDYLLNLAAANACMNKYYLQDLSTLIDCCDLGYHQSISKVLHFYLSSRQWAQQNLSTGMRQLETMVSELSQSQDRDTLMQFNNSAFCLPLRFQYHPYEGDQSGKLLQSAQSSILESLAEIAFGSTPDFPSSPSSPEGNSDVSANKNFTLKRRASLPDAESLYFTKVRDHLCNSSLRSKLEAKHDLLKVAIQKAESFDGNHTRTRSKRSVRHKKSNPGSQINQKLFNGDLLSYIQASGQLIPAVVESCIRFINLNGLHHEGLFRVPGSQMVVNQLKDAFEKGDDPLTDERCDMDSVAGVLKLYFRGLEKPLFPEDSYDQLMECGQIDDETKKVTQLKLIVSSYPPSLIIVMRYLFAFLHHVSQYSDENMMQPYNLAVCFGPSLVRGPNNGDAAELQRINALVKSIIIQHESIFPSQNELPGPVYEKCMTLEEDDCEAVAEEGDGESEQVQIKEPKDELQALALFDYIGRSSTELSFKHGDRFIVYSKASSDWWKGEVNGSKGLIPNKYISVQSVDGGQDQKGKETLKSSCGRHQTEEEVKAEKSTRLKVTTDKAGVGPSQVTSGKICLQLPTGQFIQPGNSPGALRKTLDPQMRRSTTEGGSREECSTDVDKEVHHMMHSVFKELLNRQSSPDQNTSASSEITSTVQTPSVRGLGWKGKGLFRSADNAAD